MSTKKNLNKDNNKNETLQEQVISDQAKELATLKKKLEETTVKLQIIGKSGASITKKLVRKETQSDAYRALCHLQSVDEKFQCSVYNRKQYLHHYKDLTQKIVSDEYLDLNLVEIGILAFFRTKGHPYRGREVTEPEDSSEEEESEEEESEEESEEEGPKKTKKRKI